jgi:hypothetical protein
LFNYVHIIVDENISRREKAWEVTPKPSLFYLLLVCKAPVQAETATAAAQFFTF